MTLSGSLEPPFLVTVAPYIYGDVLGIVAIATPPGWNVWSLDVEPSANLSKVKPAVNGAIIKSKIRPRLRKGLVILGFAKIRPPIFPLVDVQVYVGRLYIKIVVQNFIDL